MSHPDSAWIPKYRHGQRIAYRCGNGARERVSEGIIDTVCVRDHGFRSGPHAVYSVRRDGVRRRDHIGDERVLEVVP